MRICGPGTKLEYRLNWNDLNIRDPINNLDAICQRHDITYSKAQSLKDTHIADNTMLDETSCTQDAWWWAMQGVRTVYSTTWEEKTRKATNPVSQIHSTPFGRHRQHDWPGQAVWIGTGSLWLEEARSRLLCSRPMMMMMMKLQKDRIKITGNSWHCSCLRSIYCRSIVFLVVV